MNSEFKIKSTQGAAVIRSTHDMGGGIDGYYLMAKNDDKDSLITMTFDVPYCSTPEEEWKTLSEIGKENIRNEGWDKFRNLDEILVYALEYIRFDKDDADSLAADYEAKSAAILSKTEEGLKNIESFDPGTLRQEVKSLQSINKILKTWEKKDEIKANRERTYGSFTLPKN